MIKLTEPINKKSPDLYSEPTNEMGYIPGVWLNGKCYWLQNCGEKVIYQEEVILKVKQEHFHSKIRFFNLFVSNHSNQTKSAKIISMHHHPKISQEHFTFVSPKDHAVLHITNKEIFMVSGVVNGSGINEYTVQPYLNTFSDQIWSCPEKGKLKYYPMIKGPSVSILASDIIMKPHETVTLSTWIIKGEDKSDVVALDKALIKNILAFH